MSRIHEALQRAEQESQAGANQACRPTDAADMPVSTPEVSPPIHGGVLIDDIAARCAHPAWDFSPGNAERFCANGNIGPGTEQFRTLRSRLYQIREKQPLKTVLVAGAMPAEGKSFVAANLAHIITKQRGRRALLIDADLRKPRLHQALGAPSSPGLTEYLEGAAAELAIVQKGSVEDLYFIPAGQPSPHAAELLSGDRFRSLVQSVASAFDWVIVDGPPAVLVSDASMIARACDAVILVVQAAVTPHDAVQKALDEFRTTPVIGVVLNRVDEQTVRKSRYYNYGGPHEHSYGYGIERKRKQKK